MPGTGAGISRTAPPRHPHGNTGAGLRATDVQLGKGSAFTLHLTHHPS